LPSVSSASSSCVRLPFPSSTGVNFTLPTKSVESPRVLRRLDTKEVHQLNRFPLPICDDDRIEAPAP